MAYQKLPKRSDLLNNLYSLARENEKLTTQKYKAGEKKAFKVVTNYLTNHFGKTWQNLILEHTDNSGYWFSFNLISDKRKQNICIRHTDI